MATFTVQHFDGVTADASWAAVEFLEASLRLRVSGEDREFEITSLRVSPRIGSTNRFLYLPNGEQLNLPDCAQLDRLQATDRSENIVSWLDDRWWAALTAVVCTAVIVALGYFVGLPRLTERIIAHVPLEQERRLGLQALSTLDDGSFFTRTQLTSEQRVQAIETFDRIRRNRGRLVTAQLEFRAARGIGANALALPGGVIVVTDDMVNLCASQDELAAIMAHELGHFEMRHSLRSVLQNAGVAVMAGVVLGDVSSVVVFSSFPTVLASLKYSRTMETAADDYAVGLLDSRGIAAEHFAVILKRLMNQTHTRSDRYFSYLSSHPDTQFRIDRVRHFAAQSSSQ